MIIRLLALTVAAATLAVLTLLPAPSHAQGPRSCVAPPTTYHLAPAARAFRCQTFATHPCIGRIVDVEDGSWDPTISYGGRHDTSASYGLPQANPGTKMVSAGPAWATDRATQLRWAIGYANGRYGGECAAWSFRSSHGWW